MEANNFDAIALAHGMDQAALLQFLRNALDVAQVPIAPIIEERMPAVELVEEDEEENDNIMIVKSEKGKNKAVHRGFQFSQDQKTKDGSKQFWKCAKFQIKNGGCKARLHTLTAGNVFRKLVPHNSEMSHNHSLDLMAVPRSNIMSNLKRRDLDTRESPKELLNHELQNAPLALAPSLSSSASRKMIRKCRIANQIPVVEANNVQNLTFSETSKKYTDATGQEQLFVLKNSGQEDAKRIVLLGKERNIDWSGDMKVTYWDGSFSMTPAPFYQVYAILAERSARDAKGGKWVFPVMYPLLMDKTASSYTKMMQMIKEVWPLFNPTTISMDFEQAAIQSAIEVFQDSQIAGCLFHLVKNFKKRSVKWVSQCAIVNRNFLMMMSLAFVPPTTIWDNYKLLRTHLLAYDQNLAPVLNWFRRNYVGTQMRPPRFPVQWWSCYERTLAGEDRTNIADCKMLWEWIIQLC